MPRRHNRDQREPEPLIIAPSGVPASRRRDRMTDRRNDEARRQKYRIAQEAAARRKRIMAAVDWDVCVVPGCLTKASYVPTYERDVDLCLPVCVDHAVIIKRQIDPMWHDEEVIALRDKRQRHREQLIDGQERAHLVARNSRHGQLYFLRANGLIKVGWSSDLESRLKAYGPDVDVLCHYPGSRDDETHMHRQLRPYLAKGREWYTDCKLIEDVVAGIIRQHGRPTVSAFWTEPKPEPIKRRRSA